MKIEQIKSIVTKAQEAAQIAADDYKNKGTFSPCGFAWVNITGKGNFTKYAKAELGALKNYKGTGFDIWYTRIYDTKGSQDVEKHIIACVAFTKVLRENGIKAITRSRLD